MIGKTLTYYQITSRIGKGGMGEVYRAKDLKLGREVAIKVLPEEFVRDSDRVARFQREARLLASLNHPNIATIHGLEESGETHFLVLELVEGETLADRIKRGPVPVDDSLKLAVQIAEALEAAHEQGVIHRDLKPANIKVTPDGKVKVLDFGLAKAFVGEQPDMNLSNSPTLSDGATRQGVILGTAAYMSPEQAKGKPVDRGTDIWAFGCVLYEMLTGQAAFGGEDVTEILASVVKADVNLDLLPADIHPRVREILARCLQKERGRRYRDIGDARLEIEQVLSDPEGVSVQTAPAGERRAALPGILPWAAAVVGMVLVGALVWVLRTPESPGVMRFDHKLRQDDYRLAGGNPLVTGVSISPDGTQFVYGLLRRGLYLRSMGEPTDKRIDVQDDRVTLPFFSPDGRWIGYVSRSDNQLKKIPADGGAPTTVCACGELAFGPSWGADDTIVYSRLPGDIMRVSARGGTPKPIVHVEKGTVSFPQILPGGKSVLFTQVAAKSLIMVQSLESGKRKELFEGRAARYIPTGHIVYISGSSLRAVPFDIKALEVTGESVSMVEGVFGFQMRLTEFAVSDSGTLVYLPGNEEDILPKRTLVWVNREGKEEPLAAPPEMYVGPRISPDRTKLAFGMVSQDNLSQDNMDIWIYDIARGTRSRLTVDEAADNYPLWTPDGQRVVFSSDRGGTQGVYWKKADGTGKTELLASVPNRTINPWAWSGDGKSILLLEFVPGENPDFDIGLLSMEGDRERKLLLHEKYFELPSLISPDGQWMAYTSMESGKAEVYIRPFPDVDTGKRQVSEGGGTNPLWSPDGREMFYRDLDGGVMTVDVETEPTLKLGNPELLFRGNYPSLSPEAGQAWDINPDDNRFIMMKRYEPAADSSTDEFPGKIDIVLNWFEEVKQRAPVR